MIPDNLNGAQKRAVEKTDGPVMILAGAGSGKTRTLVAKVSYLLDVLEVSPYKILAVTFSNKAAREMRDRVGANCNLSPGALQITTFHSFCANILRSEARHLGLSRNFTIYDDSESKSVVKVILNKRGINLKELPPSHVLHFISDLKNRGYYEGTPSDEFDEDKQDELFGLFLEYESELHRSNAVDFGGLITAVIQLFEKFPEVRQRYEDRYQYIMVDEYQDTNRAQFELVRILSEKKQNICVVGDEDQSIYSWRGADIRNILDFEKVFPHAEIIKLEQNYRSSKTIIEAATQVISKNLQRKGKSMWTDNIDGDAIDVIECHNDKVEGEFLAKEIKKLKEDGESYDDMAIFYRSNAQSRIIEDSLLKGGIPYRVVAGIKFYERKEVKDLLAYIRVVVNSKDSLALSRIVNVPTRGIGATTLRKIEGEAIRMGCSLWEIVEKISQFPEDFSHIKLSARIKSSFQAFESLVNEVKLGEQNGIAPSAGYDKLLIESGYLQSLKASRDYESLARIENLQELFSAIRQYEESSTSPTLSGFLETITLDTSRDEEENPAGQVALMTVHSSKGLEFPYAFITGAEENVFPSYQSLESDSETAIEEERRLFYVAMTRAMKKLYITFAQGRMVFGNLRFNGPSRFIEEIPKNFYKWVRKGARRTDASSCYDNDEDFNQDTGPSEVNYHDVQINIGNPVKRQSASYQKGQKVTHSLYGEGVVWTTEGFGSEEKVTIKFPGGVLKKFMVKFAPLS
ncbi:MAG: UvrD-helicase domain-containing protein [Bacteriovoracaceae bacterium]|jgi:DNA helicase II / ATP-dependent DNA helicase PcrA|nr:UvrD-helicase domain-containing protein [Bacteriovoracaceae bacterium]